MLQQSVFNAISLAWVSLLVGTLLLTLPPVSLKHLIFCAQPSMGLHKDCPSGEVNLEDIHYESLFAFTYIFHVFFSVVFYWWINFLYMYLCSL
jgi:hypothetical protein